MGTERILYYAGQRQDRDGTLQSYWVHEDFEKESYFRGTLGNRAVIGKAYKLRCQGDTYTFPRNLFDVMTDAPEPDRKFIQAWQAADLVAKTRAKATRQAKKQTELEPHLAALRLVRSTLRRGMDRRAFDLWLIEEISKGV